MRGRPELLFVLAAVCGASAAGAVVARGQYGLHFPPDTADACAALAAFARECPSLDLVVVPVLAGSTDGVPAAVVEQARALNLRVVAGLSFYELGAEGNAATRRDDSCVERAHSVPCGATRDGPFASPWAPSTRDRLMATARAVGGQGPPIDGLYVDPRLSKSLWWGFSDAARLAHIGEAGIDPLDLPLTRLSPERCAPLRAWMEWRLSTASALLRDVVGAFRGARPTGAPAARVVLLCSPQSPLAPLEGRAQLLEDWVPWCLDGLADELVFDVDLDAADPSADVKRGLALAGKLALADRVWLRVPGRAGSSELPIGDVCSRVRRLHAPAPPLLLDPASEGQLRTVLDAIGRGRDGD